MRHAKAIVAVPVCNEVNHIGRCLAALAAPVGAPLPDIVLLLNNCSDGTADEVRRLTPSLGVPLHLIECTLPQDQASAGYARRLAMQYAFSLAAPGSLLVTTDADGQVASDWLSETWRAIAAGADVVCGQAEIDPDEAKNIPPHLHADDARECAYDRIIDELHAILDPDPSDAWPRHTQHSGASIAVTWEAYVRSGGVPSVALGEDRAFINALPCIDARIRHAPSVKVTVSGRLYGRARGGMADTIRRRMVRQDETIDDRLEPALDAARRATLRRTMRDVWSGVSAGDRRGLARDLQLSTPELDTMLAAPFFGAAWNAAELQSPSLLRTPVAIAELPDQTRQASRLLALARRRTAASAAV